MISATDADIDLFRIKIWEEDELGVESVLYDNTLGSEDGAVLGGGNIVVHKTK